MLREFLRNPVRAIRRGLLAWKYRGQNGYDAERFWRDRHQAFGFDKRGVGYTKLTHDENEDMYRQAKEVFLDLCRTEGVDFPRARMLDIGCGGGFYAEIFKEQGGRAYLGVDITEVLLPGLRERFAGFRFEQLDVTAEPPPGTFDLIVMIDVTQHIVSDEKFARAMAHIQAALAPQGVFVVTSWLDANKRDRFFERSRDLEAYRRALPGCAFGEPRPFRDKFIFAVRRSSGMGD